MAMQPPVPEAVEVDVGEETAAVIEQPLTPDRIGAGCGRCDPEIV